MVRDREKNNQLIIHSFLVKFQLIRENELIDISARLSTITYQVLWSWIISFLLGIVVYFATYFYEHLHTISHISVFSKSFLNADVRWLIKRLKDFFCLAIECWCSFKYIQGAHNKMALASWCYLWSSIIWLRYLSIQLAFWGVLIFFKNQRIWQLLSYSFPFKRKFHLAITLFYHVVKFKLYMYAIITFLDLGKKYII